MEKGRDGGLSRRRFLKGLGAAGLATAAMPGVTALSGWGKAHAKPKNLYFYSWTYGIPYVKQRIKEYESRYGIPIVYGNTPGAQYHETMNVKFAGGTPLDVVYVIDTHLVEWVDAGWLAPIDEFPRVKEYSSELIGPSLEAMTVKGKLYGLVYYVGHMMFLYNIEMLEKAGIGAPPKTWDELVSQGKQLKEKGITDSPFFFSFIADFWQSEQLAAQVYSRGERFIDKNLNSTDFDKEGSAAYETLKWIKDAINVHKVVPRAVIETGENEALQSFRAGKHAFLIGPSYRMWHANDPKASQVAGKVKPALMPVGRGSKPYTCGWTRMYSMTSQAYKDKDRRDYAWKLIDLLGGKNEQGVYETAKHWFMEGGLGFGMAPLFDDPDVIGKIKQHSDPQLLKTQQALTVPRNESKATWVEEWDDYSRPRFIKAVLGEDDILDVLKASRKKWDDLKEEYG